MDAFYICPPFFVGQYDFSFFSFCYTMMTEPPSQSLISHVFNYVIVFEGIFKINVWGAMGFINGLKGQSDCPLVQPSGSLLLPGHCSFGAQDSGQ